MRAKAKRVLLALSSAVLTAGVEGLLRRRAGFQLSRLTAADGSLIHDELLRLRPDVLIVDEHTNWLPPLLVPGENGSDLPRRILVLHEHSNVLHVIEVCAHELHGSGDLVKFVTAPAPSPKTVLST